MLATSLVHTPTTYRLKSLIKRRRAGVDILLKTKT